jgi:hypothetical protein
MAALSLPVEVKNSEATERRSTTYFTEKLRYKGNIIWR